MVDSVLNLAPDSDGVRVMPNSGVQGVPLVWDGRRYTKSSESPKKTATETTPVTSEIIRADMPEAVLDGRLGEIYQRRLRHFPIAFAWGALVAAAGTLIARSANQAMRTNLFFCSVGDKGTGKSQSFETTFDVLGLRNSPVLVEGKFGSAEGLIERLKDSEAEAVRLIAIDELGYLLTKASIDFSSFPFILNSAYYKDQISGGSKKQQFNFDCRISLAGGIVEELFGDSFGVSSIGGLYDRFIFGLCPQPYQFLYRPFEGRPETIRPFLPLVDADVWDARDDWAKSGVNPRIGEHALRVAFICAAVDGRPSLRAADLAPAVAFAQYQARVRRILTPNPGENPDAKCAIKIRAWLSDHTPNGEWVNRRDLHRGISATRFGPGIFHRCLQNLQFNSEIELDKAGQVRLI